MKGLDTRCRAAPDDNLEGTSCCVHLRVRHNDYICCWCGDLFEGDPFPTGRHGQYRPRRERR